MRFILTAVCAFALSGCAALDQYSARRSAEYARARHAEHAEVEHHALRDGTTIRRIDACREERCIGHGRICTMNILDADGDGSAAASCGGEDCRDDDPTVSPNMSEIRDGIDNDCDGMVDETCAPGESLHL
ncbi:MAG: putative metal-binding motif-containing protein [Patescibacteria group bacterium]